MHICPNCGGTNVKDFYEVRNVPIHDVVLIKSRKEAINYPKRDVKLGYCSSCGFIFNMLFDFSVLDYDEDYEETQGFSPTFTSFHEKLAERLIEKYNLKNKSIIEIGCGKGEFLSLLCDKGDNTGYGFDPAYVSGRFQSNSESKITFIKDFYSEKYAHYHGDFYCCKMTLEHIPNTLEFISMIRKCIGDNYAAKVYFLLPDAEKVFNELGFWDIFYEHCSYFCLSSLSFLFERGGFEVIQIGKEYDDQYLMIEAQPRKKLNGTVDPDVNLRSISDSINSFRINVFDSINNWKNLLNTYRGEGKKVVLWGAGSKGVAFLTTLGISDEIEYAVDINPFKKGTYMAVSGQQIVSPDFLVKIIMNPIYMNEIKEDLNNMKLDPILVPIDHMHTLHKEHKHES